MGTYTFYPIEEKSTYKNKRTTYYVKYINSETGYIWMREVSGFQESEKILKIGKPEQRRVRGRRILYHYFNRRIRKGIYSKRKFLE